MCCAVCCTAKTLHIQNLHIFFVTIESQNSFYSFDKMLLEKSNYENCALALFIRVFYNEQQCFLSIFFLPRNSQFQNVLIHSVRTF